MKKGTTGNRQQATGNWQWGDALPGRPFPLACCLFPVSCFFLFLSGAGLLAACDSGPRREAESLSVAVDRFRQADNATRPAAADALRAVPCTATDVCQARDACLAFSEPTAKALRLKHEVEEGLKQLETGALPKDSPAARMLPEKLEQAEAMLREGQSRLTSCDDQMLALKRRHRL